MKISPASMAFSAYHERGIRRSLLAFSGGKDSLASWCVMQGAGIEVIPVYHYVFPGLSFVERMLAYYEKRFQTPIIRLPHPWLLQVLYYGAFSCPIGMKMLCEGEYKSRCHDFASMLKAVRESLGDPNLWNAVGVKCGDSQNRSLVVTRCQGFDEKNLKWYPLGYCGDRVAIEILARYDMPVPDDYWEVGRSYDVLTPCFCKGIAKYHPEDWKQIVEVFPLIETQLFRGEV